MERRFGHPQEPLTFRGNRPESSGLAARSHEGFRLASKMRRPFDIRAHVQRGRDSGNLTFHRIPGADSMSKSKVLLIEDDNLLRMGLKSMIDLRGEYVVGSDVATGREAIQSFHQNRADIVLLDLRLPDMPGTEVLKRLREMDKQTKIIVLTACDSDEMLFETLEFGTNAYVLKGENPDELFLAIKYALNDDLFISPRLARTIVKDYLFATRQRKGFPTLQGLTARELEVVKLILDGRKSREIADLLSISIKTVDKHRSNILQKIGMHNFNELRHGGLYFLDFPKQAD